MSLSFCLVRGICGSLIRSNWCRETRPAYPLPDGEGFGSFPASCLSAQFDFPGKRYAVREGCAVQGFTVGRTRDTHGSSKSTLIDPSHVAVNMSETGVMTRVFCGLMLLAACGTAQTVDGTIVNSVTGTGVAVVRVFLMPVSGQTGYSATTDAVGHFVFKGVETGTYRFGYMSPGYLSSDPMPPGRQVEISGDGTPVKLEGRMSALPRISGRVVDGDGKGIANALLGIIGRNDPPVTSDAEGQFGLRLNPGAYILSVVPPTGLKPPEPDGERVLVWTRTFYPGVSLLEATSKIVLRPGSELSGVVIKLLAVPSHAVSGVLLTPTAVRCPGRQSLWAKNRNRRVAIQCLCATRQERSARKQTRMAPSNSCTWRRVHGFVFRPKWKAAARSAAPRSG